MELPQIHDVVFVLEDTAMNQLFHPEIRNNYIQTLLNHFSGGSNKDVPWASIECSTTFTLVTYQSADALPNPLVGYEGPFTYSKQFLAAYDRVKFIGGAGEDHANGVDGLAMALLVFDRLESIRANQNLPTKPLKYIIYISTSPAYDMPVMDVSGYMGLSLDDLVAKIRTRDIRLSIVAPTKLPFLLRLFKSTGGNVPMHMEKNYAKDRRHLILINGDILPEVPLTPLQTSFANTSQANALTGHNQSQQPHLLQQQQQQQQQQPSVMNTTNTINSTMIMTNQGPDANQIGMNPSVSETMAMPQTSMAQPRMIQQVDNSMGQQTMMRPQLQRPLNPNNIGQQPSMPMNPMQQMQMQRMQQQQQQQQLQGQQPGQPQRMQMMQQQQLMQQQQQQNPRQPWQPNTSMGGPTQSSVLRDRLSQKVQQQQLQQQQQPQQQQQQHQQQQQQQQQQLQQGANATDNPTLTKLLNHPPQGLNPNVPGGMNMPGGRMTALQQQLSRPLNPMATTSQMMNPILNQQQPQQQQQMMVQQQQMQPQQQQQQQQQINRTRETIWEGDLTWTENSKVDNQQKKTKHVVRCSVTSPKDPNTGLAKVKSDNWPRHLIMQLISKSLAQTLGSQFFQNSSTVLFHPEQSDSLMALTRVLGSDYAGCVHFTGDSNNRCEIKVLILLYSREKNAYLGFIPNDQNTFVDRIRTVIHEQKEGQKQQQLQQQQQQQQHQLQLNQQGGSGMMQPQLQQQMMTMGGGTMTMANQGQQPNMMGVGMMNQSPNISQQNQDFSGMMNHPQQTMMRPVGMVGMPQHQQAGLRQVLQQQQTQQPQFQQRGMMPQQMMMPQQQPQQQQHLHPHHQQQQQQQQQHQQHQQIGAANDPMLRELLG